MSKKSQKSSSQQQEQQQQQQQQQPTQPKNQPEAGRHKRHSSAQSKGAAGVTRDPCDLFAEAGPVVTSDVKQAPASENNSDKVGHHQPVQAAPKSERNKRARLQPSAGGAENKPVAERMGDSQGAGLALPDELTAANVRQSEQNICAACAKPIRERYLLMALDKRWHEDCLKCACCDCRLGEVGSSLFTHSDKLLCRRDFMRIFGKKGLCAACHRQIPAYELVMRAQEKAYHMDCFACQRCQYRFCVGDQFHMTQAHKIICLLCHREQLERCQQQAQEQEVDVGLVPSHQSGAFDEQQLACEKQEQLHAAKQQQQQPEEDEKPRAELDESPLVVCPVQQMRLPSQQEQERPCVM